MENIKEILDVFTHAISQIKAKEINLTDEKYNYLFTVDSINDLVMQGKSFLKAYKEIGEQVQNGAYKATSSKEHSHIGSKDNLGLEEIKKKKNGVRS